MAEVKEKKPGRIAKFFRDYKSELKKISWCPFKTVKGNTILVCVTVVLLAIVIGLLDLGSAAGLAGIGKLFG